MEPKKIERELLDFSVRHFGQAQTSPFTIDPIKRNFLYEGTNELIHNLITKGEIPPE
jgi:hypothetical protein